MITLLIGVPGSGKTTAACTAPPPVGLIDVDGKADQMHNIQHLIKKGDVVIVPVKSKMVEDTFEYRALNPDKGPKEQPKGYIEIVNMLNSAIDNDGIFKDFKTTCLDSLSRTVEHMKRLLIYHRAKGKFGKIKDDKKMEDMNWPSWGSYLSNLEEIFGAAAGYWPKGKHFVCCVHEKEYTEKDPITEVEITKGYWPMIDGQMREKLAGYFNEVYFMQKQNRIKKGVIPAGIDYHFRTMGKKYCARTSYKLDELVEPNLSKILNEE